MKFSVKIIKKKKPRTGDRVYRLIHFYYYDKHNGHSYSIDFKIYGKKRIRLEKLMTGNLKIELNFNPYYIDGTIIDLEIPKRVVIEKLEKYIRVGHGILSVFLELIDKQEKEDRT